MRRFVGLLLSLVSLCAVFVAASPVRADELQLASRRAQRREAWRNREDLERQGFSPRLGVRSGMAIVPRGFVPTIAVDWGIAGGITDRFTLGAQASLVGYLGLKTGGGVDIVAEGFLGRGWYLRLGLGAQGNLPARAADVQAAGFGGSAGVGYEFRLFDRLGLALGVDYDGRVRVDGIYAQRVLGGIDFRGYFKKKH